MPCDSATATAPAPCRLLLAIQQPSAMPAAATFTRPFSLLSSAPQLRQSEAAGREEAQRLCHERDALAARCSDFERRHVQAQHEIRRKEAEYAKLQVSCRLHRSVCPALLTCSMVGCGAALAHGMLPAPSGRHAPSLPLGWCHATAASTCCQRCPSSPAACLLAAPPLPLALLTHPAIRVLPLVGAVQLRHRPQAAAGCAGERAAAGAGRQAPQ